MIQVSVALKKTTDSSLMIGYSFGVWVVVFVLFFCFFTIFFLYLISYLTFSFMMKFIAIIYISVVYKFSKEENN